MLAIEATPSVVAFDVDLALTRDHPAYSPPPSNQTECFRVGRVRFVEVLRLVWEEQGAAPATDASGEIDFGHIDSLVWDDNVFMLEGDWGRMELSAARAEVEIPALSDTDSVGSR